MSQNIRKIHNTRNLLKEFCQYVYYAGAGNCWYEDIYHETLIYRTYTFVSFFIYTVMIFLENLAALFGDFPDVEKNSAFMFAAIHDIVLIKMYLILYRKKTIRTLNYGMAAVGENIEETNVMNKQYKKVKVGIILYIISVYLSLGSFGVESLRKSLMEGVPFYTVVTYLPKYSDPSIYASIFRVFFYITWLYMMLPMMSADCFPITHLITLSYKFMSLCHHYERIGENFKVNVKINMKDALENLKAECLEGIRIHQRLKVLGCEIDRIFGIIMALQVCESSAVAVLLLLRLALSPHLDLTNAFMTYTFVGSLFLLLALNLWNAGEVTYQASRLSDAMFHCGWQLTPMQHPSHRDIRRLVLVGCAVAQRPLVLKAFKIQDLSYETFVSVARMTYSIFAVFYNRGGN